jgi:hypothetical protein
MAEIKSTLDIIMEKAKKYTVTEEEKSAFRRRELEGRIKGLFQKYVDGLMDLERIKEETAAAGQEERRATLDLMRAEALDRIQPGENNGPLLDILSMTGMDTGPVEKLLLDYEKKIAEEKERSTALAMERLRKRGISGSAVLPNLDAEEVWLKALSEAGKAFRDELKAFS